MPQDMLTLLLVLAAVVALGAIGLAVFAFTRKPGNEALEKELAAIKEQQSTLMATFSGRLQAMMEGQSATQASLTQAVTERLDQVSLRMSASLEETGRKTSETLGNLTNRLTVIDQAQKNISELSSQVVGLQDILANKQARGAFGEIQLHDIVTSALPPSAYSFQSTLGNRNRADCLILLPNPPGPIAIDAKFPLDAYHALRKAESEAEKLAAQRQFRADLIKHINDISSKYIIPGETAESALMFLPSEAVYAELHANFPEVVTRSYQARVWIVSPTTLMATLNTVRAVLKDSQMREQAGVIQKYVGLLLQDVVRLQKRVDNLDKHFQQAEGDIREIRTSTDQISKRGEKIQDVEMGEDGETPLIPAKRAQPSLID